MEKPYRGWLGRVPRLLCVAALAVVVLAGLGAESIAVGAEEAKPKLNDADVFPEAGTALFMLFVLAVLIENALAVIFNWRVYLTFFNSRGVKTIVMIGVALVVVNGLNLDVVASLVEAYSGKTSANQAASTTAPAKGQAGQAVPAPATGQAAPAPPAVQAVQTPDKKSASNWMTVFLTALILAGGSSGVYSIMVALGYRDPKAAAEKIPKPAKNKAWVAIRVVRNDARGPILVHLNEVTGAKTGSTPAIAGTISTQPLRRKLREQFLRDPNRFPQSGGYPVDPDKVYDLKIEARDVSDQPIPSSIDGQYTFADGAIVDLDVTL